LKLEKEKVYLPLNDVENMYLLICEEYTKNPVGRVLFQAFLKNLEAAGIIIIGKGFQLGLDGVKVEILEKFLVDVLEQI
jgi:hypothetical protein